MDYSKGTRQFHSLASNPHFFPNVWSAACGCFSQLHISEGRDALSFNGKDSSLSQLLMSLSSILLASGAPVRGGSCAVSSLRGVSPVISLGRESRQGITVRVDSKGERGPPRLPV